MSAFFKTAWRWTGRLLLGTLGLSLVGGAVGTWAYRRHVVQDPGPHIERAAILAVIAQESPVLYADGETRIGVFFDEEHREYVPYERIPTAWVQAIVAAEDQRFFSHFGVDPKGITRAMLDNLLAGAVVAGGSTLTQQTAKNLYYRPDRSMRSKWEELVNALRLEAHYSKEEILEFYANQFHVSANGRGLGIAARYFFDKEVEELDTLECAFLAGLVKGPANYNPFVGSTEERRELARSRAKARTRYVLDRMLDTGAIDAGTHAALIAREIPFKRGTFRYDTHVILDEVALRLAQAPFPELFESLGIDNPSTAGIQVVTTIDRPVQEGATWALWHHLSEVGPLLEGGQADWKGAAAFLRPGAAAPLADPHDPPQRYQFREGRVLATQAGARPGIDLDLGGHRCRVDAEGVQRAATVIARARKGEAWRQAGPADVEELLAALSPADSSPGDKVVWASVRRAAVDGSTDPALCDLELRPELQGAVLVLEDGAIRAMVGGNDNRNFNRATQARRQLGSTWKPVLYFAAIQLGWRPDDVLDNRPGQAFRFESSWYYPRPDHASEPFVSLAWAGTRSENLATIWLMAHLLDHLDSEAFRDLARSLDLAPRKGEAQKDWVLRIRDQQGIISTKERLPELAFGAVKGELAAELVKEGRAAQAQELSSLLYGAGVQEELQRQGGDRDRVAALSFNLLRLEELLPRCEAQVLALQKAMDGAEGATLAAGDLDLLYVRPGNGVLQLGCGPQGEGWIAASTHLAAAASQGLSVELSEPTRMVVEGRLEADVLRRVRRDLERRALVFRLADPWSLEVLEHHPDFRLLVGMRYLARVANAYGVQVELPTVLSMPLGAADISLEEAGLLYQGMLRGEVWSFPGTARTGALGGQGEVGATAAPTLLIAEIRDRNGELLYRARPGATALTEPLAGRLVGDILRNVVRWGTGRRAVDAVKLGEVVVPVAGKTGTTNSNRNAAFVGFVPRAVSGSSGPRWRWGEGYTVAAYVGYDDNREMRRVGVRLAGASGALPSWILTAQALADAGKLGTAPPVEPEWEEEAGLRRVPLADGSGLPLADAAAAEAGGRSALIALDQGLWGLGEAPRRLIAPVKLPSALGAAAPPPVPALPLPPQNDPASAETPSRPDADPDPSPVDPTGGELAGESAAGPGAPAGEEEPSDGDAVRAWLGELIDAPAAGTSPGPTVPEADDSGIVPRITPSTPEGPAR